MRTTLENLYKHASYSYTELFYLIVYGFLIGFLFSFDDWGVDDVRNTAIGVQNLVLYSICAILVIFIFTYVQKILGVLMGVHASHQVSWTYLVVSILLCFVTYGKVIIFIPPSINIHPVEHFLIGRKPFYLSVKNMRLFALLPILVLMIFGIFASELLPISAAAASILYWMCFLFSVYALIPIEFITNFWLVFAKEKAEVVLSDKIVDKAETRGVSLGSILFYGSRFNLIFALVFIVASLISQITTGFFFSAIFTFIVAAFSAFIFFVKTELSGGH